MHLYRLPVLIHQKPYSPELERHIGVCFIMLDDCDNTFESVKKEISYAYEKTLFFNKHMAAAQLSPTDIKTKEDISRIPPTEKKNYRTNFPSGVLAGGFSLNDKRLFRTQSSGTASERLETLEVGFLYLQRAMQCLTVQPSLNSAFTTYPRKHIRYAAPNCSDVECASPGSTMSNRLLQDGTLVLSVYHDLLTTPEHILSLNIEEIEKYKPQLYYIDPTHLAFLSKYMDKCGYTPSRVPIISTYSLCTKANKNQIVKVFGEDVTFAEFVSMSEVGWLAMECQFGNLHINTKSFYMELICNNRPAEPGELAELYITTLDNGCIPRIRYRTGDVFRFISRECQCGHNFPIVKMEGRLRYFLFQKGKVVLTPKGVDELVGDLDWIDLYKIIQTEENCFRFYFIPNGKYEENFDKDIIDRLFRTLGTDINLLVEKTNYIPAERSGKFLSCISSVGEQMIKNGFHL